MLDKLMKTKKLVIVDGGFSFKKKAEQNCLNRQDRMDDPELNSFKSRARLRQETFNRRLNHSDALSNTLRHKSDKYKAVFEAVIVMVQTQTDNGSLSLRALRGSATKTIRGQDRSPTHQTAMRCSGETFRHHKPFTVVDPIGPNRHYCRRSSWLE